MLMPEAFGGNRRLYTGSAPAADRRRVDPCPTACRRRVDGVSTACRRLPCNLQCILRVGFKNIVFYGVSLSWNALIFCHCEVLILQPMQKAGLQHHTRHTHTQTHTCQACIARGNFKLTCCRTVMAQTIKKPASVFFCNLTPSLNIVYIIQGPSAATDFILAMFKNRGFYVVLGSREGKKSDKLAS